MGLVTELELADADFRSASYELRDVALKIIRGWGFGLHCPAYA